MTLDDTLLAPMKLRICAYLSGCEEADYQAVREYCGLTASNLSKQMTALERRGYIAISKVASRRYTTTRLRLTDIGRAALTDHLAALQGLARDASARTRATRSGGDGSAEMPKMSCRRPGEEHRLLIR